jgi:hypothetical protein
VQGAFIGVNISAQAAGWSSHRSLVFAWPLSKIIAGLPLGGQGWACEASLRDSWPRGELHPSSNRTSLVDAPFQQG